MVRRQLNPEELVPKRLHIRANVADKAANYSLPSGASMSDYAIASHGLYHSLSGLRISSLSMFGTRKNRRYPVPRLEVPEQESDQPKIQLNVRLPQPIV